MSRMNKKNIIKINTKSRQLLLGSYQSSFKWSGITFSNIRPYVAGDPYHWIDRKTSAKKGEWYLKEFEEERLLNILLVLDVWENMKFHTITPTKFDYTLQLAELLSQAAGEAGDRLGYFLYEDQSIRYQKASRSPKHLQRLHTILAEHGATKKSSLQAAIAYLEHQHLKHHLIIWVSDHLVTLEDKHLHGLARTNDLIRVHLFDPFETTAALPEATSSTLLFHEGHKNVPTCLDTETQTEYRQHFQQALTMSDKILRSRNITTYTITTDQDPLKQLILLFQKHKHYKQRH